MYAFIIQNNFGSSHHRGIDAANITKSRVYRCGYLKSSAFINVFVHVKYVCPQILKSYNTSYHVFDRIDNFRNLDLSGFSGEIVSTDYQLKYCKTRVCAVIPHHVNIRCNFHNMYFTNKTNPTVGLVGTNTHVPYNLFEELKSFKILVEKKNDLCLFYNKIDIAISWKSLEHKPNERFSNPIWFGIPTIGYAHNRAYTEYKNANPFLCTNVSCVKMVIYGILNGSLSEKFVRLQQEVRNDVHPLRVSQMYNSMFELLNLKSSRRAVSPLL